MQTRRFDVEDTGLTVYANANGTIDIYIRANKVFDSVPIDHMSRLMKELFKATAYITSEHAKALAELPETVSEFGKSLEESTELTNRFQEVAKEFDEG